MAAPEGYSLLARIGFVDRGDYSSSATYLAGDVVYYNGSSWKALKDNLKGVTPVAGANWGYMAKGFASAALSGITAKDTSGLKGTAGAQVDAQALMDIIADKIATKLLAKTDLVSQIVNDASKAASMAALYAVKQQVDQQNSDFDNLEADIKIETAASTISLATLNQLCDPGQTKTFFYPTVTAAQALPAEFAGISYLYITLHKPMDGGGLTTYCDAVGIKNSGAIVCAYGFYGPADIVWTVK